MWPDNETATDLLGFDVHANLLRAVITDDSMLPLTIGVFGDWGGGKTSIMKMLETSLDPNTYAEGSAQHSQCNSIATVYVNTWQFEGYDDAKAALISAVLLELKEHKRFGPKVRDRALTLLRSVKWLRFGRLTLKHIAAPAAAAFFTGGGCSDTGGPRRHHWLVAVPSSEGRVWRDVLQLSKSGMRAIGRVGLAPSHAATSNKLLMN